MTNSQKDVREALLIHGGREWQGAIRAHPIPSQEPGSQWHRGSPSLRASAIPFGTGHPAHRWGDRHNLIYQTTQAWDTCCISTRWWKFSSTSMQNQIAESCSFSCISDFTICQIKNMVWFSSSNNGKLFITLENLILLTVTLALISPASRHHHLL